MRDTVFSVFDAFSIKSLQNTIGLFKLLFSQVTDITLIYKHYRLKNFIGKCTAIAIFIRVIN